MRASEAAAWLQERLEPKLSAADAARSPSTSCRPAGSALHLLRTVSTARDVFDLGRAATEVVARSGGLPPGAREGDVVVCWPVVRARQGVAAAPPPIDQQRWDSPARSLRHVAVVRDSTVIAEYALPAPERYTTTKGTTCTV